MYTMETDAAREIIRFNMMKELTLKYTNDLVTLENGMDRIDAAIAYIDAAQLTEYEANHIMRVPSDNVYEAVREVREGYVGVTMDEDVQEIVSVLEGREKVVTLYSSIADVRAMLKEIGRAKFEALQCGNGTRE